MSQLPDRAVRHRNRYYLCFIRKHLHSADRKSSGVFFQGYLSSPWGRRWGGRGSDAVFDRYHSPYTMGRPASDVQCGQKCHKVFCPPPPLSTRATPWQSVRNNVQLRSSARPHQLSPAQFCPPSN